MSANLTPWFPATAKPERKGVYLVKSPFGDRYAFWNGRKFGYRTTDAISADTYKRNSTVLPGRIEWRGLAAKP